MIKLFILPSSFSSRNAQAWLTEVGQPFVMQNMYTSPLTFEQLKEILSHTENGVEDIIAHNGKEKRVLQEEGVDFENIKLSEFYYYVQRFPKLIKAPLAIYKGRLVIGYSPERYEVLRPRQMRLKAYSHQLELARSNEDIKIAEGKAISLGHWG